MTHFLSYLWILKMAAAFSPSAIIIGAGPGGIALAYRLRYELGFEDFIVSDWYPLHMLKCVPLMKIQIYDKLDGVGGTWRANTYPGW